METRMERGIMKKTLQLSLLFVLAIFVLTVPRMSQAATAGEIDRDVDGALQTLYRTTPAAKNMAKIAKGVLVFPDIIKAGLIVGGQFGEGAYFPISSKPG